MPRGVALSMRLHIRNESGDVRGGGSEGAEAAAAGCAVMHAHAHEERELGRKKRRIKHNEIPICYMASLHAL